MESEATHPTHTLTIPPSEHIATPTSTKPSLALALVAGLFFSFGFITCMNDILVPHLKSIFALSYSQAMLIQFCFFLAYFVGSIPFGKWVQVIGYKSGMTIGLCIAGVGTALFYPAAELRFFPVFLFGFFTLALGITLLQVAANPYVTALGPQKSSSSRLNLVQAFNSLGTTLAPTVGAILILSRGGESSAVQGPYLGLTFALFSLAFLVHFSKLPQITNSTSQQNLTKNLIEEKTSTSIWQHKHLILGTLAIFAYVGAEVSIGSFLVDFLSDSKIGNIPRATAGKYVSFYWGGAMVGRFLGSWVLTRIEATKVLSVHAILAALLVFITVSSDGHLAMAAILSVGFFNSIMFPTIFTLAIRGLGSLTAQASGLLCMAIVGGAIVPMTQGIIADHIGIHLALFTPFLCYLYILFYAIKGHELRQL